MVEPLEWGGREAFKVTTSDGVERYTRHVIYAGGEYGHPYEPFNLKKVEGATIHYSKVSDWSTYVKAGRAVVVGGGEAGFDAALYLLAEMESGEVIVVDRGGSDGDEGRVTDPSTTLAPVTRSRLEAALDAFGKEGGKKKLTVLGGCECTDVASTPQGAFMATVKDKRGDVTKWRSPLPVILATGFSLGSSNCVLQGLADWDETGRPVLSPDCDEVRKTPGIFVVGPMVMHTIDLAAKEEGGSCGKVGAMVEEKKEMIQPETVIFCFVYKFRCRFALVAGEILSRLIAEHHAVQFSYGKTVDYGNGAITVDAMGQNKLRGVEAMGKKWKEKGMLTTDLSCAVCGKLEGTC